MAHLDEVGKKKRAQKAQKVQDERLQKVVESNALAGELVASVIEQEADKTRQSIQKVEVTNQPKIEVEHVQDFTPVLNYLFSVKKAVEAIPKTEIPNFPKEFSVNNLNDYTDKIDEVIKAVKSLDVKPKIDVEQPKIDVKVDTKSIAKEVSTIHSKFDELVEAISKIESKEADFSDVVSAVQGVQKSVNSLEFPIPNYVLPFKDSAGKASQVALDSEGKVPVSFTGGTSGTQYDDGDSTPATPTGTLPVFDNAGTITAVSDSNPLPVDATVNASVDLGDQDIGNASADTQRVVIASDQPVIPISDNSGSITVDASSLDIRALTNSDVVTAELSPTDNAVLDAIETTLNSIESGQLADGHNVTVDNASIAVTDNGGSLTVDNAGLTELAGAINSSQLDVNIAASDVSIGGGTEYDDGDADATPTGSVAMGTDGSNVFALLTDTSGHLQIDVLSSALPSGASTAANQTTGNNYLNSIDGLLGTIDGDTSAIRTDIGDIANTVDGTELQVDIVTMPEVAINDGGNAITVDGTVTANLGATDNAVLDNIDSTLSAIDDGSFVVASVTSDVSIDDGGNSITVDASDLDIRALTNSDVVTAELSATDNAVLDSIVSELQDVESDVEAVNTTLGGTLTVDATGQGDVPITLDGEEVTVNLGSTDNAVLDDISANTLVRGDTSTVTSVNDSATSVQLLAANSARVEATITNDSDEDLYVKLGTTASTTSYTVKLGQDESYITDKYTGRIDGIWASNSTGAARITEVDN